MTGDAGRAVLDRRGVVWGLVGVAVTLAIVFVGSDGLVWFDAALVGYLFGVLFMVFGVVYRYRVWVKRPPTAMLNRRGWDAFRDRKGHNIVALPSLVFTHLVAQGFIRRRSRARWAAHQFVFWGCLLAAAVTFPLTLGLLHFESVGQDASRYQVHIAAGRDLAIRRREHRRLVRLPRPRRRRRARPDRGVRVPPPPPPGPRARWPRSAAGTSSRSPGCSRCR